MKILSKASFSCRGFSLIEMLVVVAVIGILAALIIAAITNAAQDSRMVIARQQQAVLQEALSAWITSKASGGGSLSTARTAYASASTVTAKLLLISNYLAPATYSQFASTTPSGASALKTDAMANCGVGLQFSTWGLTNYPEVDMVTN